MSFQKMFGTPSGAPDKIQKAWSEILRTTFKVLDEDQDNAFDLKEFSLMFRYRTFNDNNF